jgi:hypothetical protein
MDTITGMADTTMGIRTGIHTIMDIHTTTRMITGIRMDTLTIIHTTTLMGTITHTRTGMHMDTIIMLQPRLRIPTTTADILTTTTTTCTAFSSTLPQTPVAR